jgi:hypothetical protein
MTLHSRAVKQRGLAVGDGRGMHKCETCTEFAQSNLAACQLYVPGVMIMLFAFIMCSTAPSTFTSVWVPVISFGLPAPVDDVPKPPMITFINDRFIACKTNKIHGHSKKL